MKLLMRARRVMGRGRPALVLGRDTMVLVMVVDLADGDGDRLELEAILNLMGLDLDEAVHGLTFILDVVLLISHRAGSTRGDDVCRLPLLLTFLMVLPVPLPLLVLPFLPLPLVCRGPTSDAALKARLRLTPAVLRMASSCGLFRLPAYRLATSELIITTWLLW